MIIAINIMYIYIYRKQIVNEKRKVASSIFTSVGVRPRNYINIFIYVCMFLSLSLSLFLSSYIYIYIYIYIYGEFNHFPDFLGGSFKIDGDSWKYSMLLLYTLWDDWPIFMISCSNEQLQQQLEYTLLKSDCHGWWISKMQSGLEDTLEERYAIKLSFQLGKNAIEMYAMLQTAFGVSCMNRASVF